MVLFSARMKPSSAGLAVMEAKVSVLQVRAGEDSGQRGSKWDLSNGRSKRKTAAGFIRRCKAGDGKGQKRR